MKKKFILCSLLIILLSPILVKAYTDEKVTLPVNYATKINGNQTGDLAYFSDGQNIYSYDLKTNKFEKIYTFDSYVSYFYQNKNIIYGSITNSKARTYIGVDVTTKEVVYNETYNLEDTYSRYFVVDNNKNLFITNKNTLYSYDVEGNLKSAITTSGIDSFELRNTSPNGEILFTRLRYNGNYIAEGYFGINADGTITTLKHKDTSRDPLWTFLDNNIALNQYGELVKFNYQAYSYELKIGGQFNRVDYYYPGALKDDNKAYISTLDGYIYKININTFQKEGQLKLGSSVEVLKIVKDGNNLQVLYKSINDTTTYYITTLSLNNLEVPKTITINNHKTLGYTKDEVIARYAKSLPTYDYSKGYYAKKPSFKSPYYEGELASGVTDDVLNQFNFYRYLSGLNEVTLNTDKMPRSQKGAFINALNQELTHFPSKKPSGMTDDFFQEASDGVGAKYDITNNDIYSGNVSQGNTSYDMVKDFVDDSNNIEPNVGHRSSMLDPYAKRISFGYTPASDGSPWRYSSGAMSVYYDTTNTNTDTFYAWPPAGYIPVESFPAKSNTMWSIWLDDSYDYTGGFSIQIEFDGKTYNVTNAYTDEDNTIFYYVPTELNKVIMTSGNKYVTDKPLKFYYKGFRKGIDIVNIEYTTIFIKATGLSLDTPNITLTKGATTKLTAKMLPSGTPASSLNFKSNNTNIVEVDKDGNVTAKGVGNTTITVSDKNGNTATCNVTVTDYLKGDMDRDGQITINDVLDALLYYVGSKETTDEIILIGNFDDNNNTIDISDVMAILLLYVNN